MNETILIGWLSLFVSTAAMFGSAVWCIASVRANTRALGRSLDALRESVNDLDKVLQSMHSRIDEISTRVARLEGAKDGGP